MKITNESKLKAPFEHQSPKDHCLPSQKQLRSGKVIWSFWEGNLPEVVSLCLSTIKAKNPSRPVVVLSSSTLPLYLEPEDYPCFHGVRGSTSDFSCVQYLADWVRLTLLEKYGGVWFDASTICTAAVECWISSESTDAVTMFPMHANPNIHGNWALGTCAPGNPVIRAWRAEFAAALNEAGPREIPFDYIERAFREHQGLYELWNFPTAPPLPYLWVYLTLQVVLQKNPELHSAIRLLPSTTGPMYRRYLFDVMFQKQIDCVSQMTANHLATQPLQLETYDRWFVKLVGSDRTPVQTHLDEGSFVPDSALETLSCQQPVSLSPATGLVVFPSLKRISLHREISVLSNSKMARRRSSVASAA